jgi:hypothetical protein
MKLKMKILKNILKFFILPLLVVIIIALVIISVNFSKIEFDDQFEVTTDYSSYYPSDYENARHLFRILAGELDERYNNVQNFSIKVPSQIDDDLTVDISYLPAQKDSTNLIILISGLHGVEGYVGHAVQQLFVRMHLNDHLVEDTGILLIHGVNPFGFKYTRKVTENNIDLNRNSPSGESLYETINDGYPVVYDLVNPKAKVNKSSLGNRLFFLKAINEIRKASLPVLRQAVLQGQYEFAEGIYYGGKQPEPQIEALEPLIASISRPYQKILALDIHTGYGERGKLHFFPNPMEGEEKERMEKLLEGYTIDWGDNEDFYVITGDFTGFIGAINPGKEYYSMLLEYGTLNSQTTMGSLKSIHVNILDNQGFHYGYISAKDSLYVKSGTMEMYSPSSTNWRNYILQQTDEVFTKVIPRFTGR